MQASEVALSGKKDQHGSLRHTQVDHFNGAAIKWLTGLDIPKNQATSSQHEK